MAGVLVRVETIGDATIHIGDCRDVLHVLAGQGLRAQTCVTSPPYWGLRQYLPEGSVVIKRDLPEAQRQALLEELARLGVRPCL